MKLLIACAFASAAWLTLVNSVLAQPAQPDVVIHAEPLNGGRIEPTLFGNFVELLDDVVPGMWSELLNDRSFPGVIPPAKWVYCDGALDICDRQWDTNSTWTYDIENPFNGKHCAKLTAGSGPASLTQSGLSARKDLNYAFSAYLRGDNSVKATVSLKFLEPTGEWTTLASAELPAVSWEWRKYSVKLTSNGRTDQAVFELRAEGNGDLSVNKLSLMPGDNMSGWRADVVEAIKEIHPSIIRWGGSTVDPGNYHWKNGIGDRDFRTPWTNMNWGRIDSNDVGIDEFCQFCELTSAEPLICLSFADGAASAGDLVQYCNGPASSVWGAKRVSNGHPAPYHVKYWEVGNEISGNNPKYLGEFHDFIKAIRGAEPEARIMTSYPSQRLLSSVGSEVDFVCPHHYTTDLNECELDFDRIAHMIDYTPGCSKIKMAVTEWNIDAGAWGLGRMRQATLQAGLANARYLNLMMRHSDKVKIANRSNLANSYWGATILTAPSGYGVLRQPSHYVMKLYSLHAKPVPLWVEQYNDQADLFACGSDDKKSLVIFAVNTRKEGDDFRRTGLNIGFSGFQRTPRILKAEGVCDTLELGQPDVENHWHVAERIKIVDVPVSGNVVTLPPLSAVAIECGTD